MVGMAGTSVQMVASHQNVNGLATVLLHGTHSNFRTGLKWSDFNPLAKSRAKRLHSPQGVTHSFLGERGDVKAFGYRKKEGAPVGWLRPKISADACEALENPNRTV
jgi:hypothetical protein